MAEHRVYELLTGLRAAVRVIGESGDKSDKASPKPGWRQKFLVSGAPQVIIYARRLDGRFTTTFMSDNVEALLGHEPRNFVEDPSFWSDCIHPEDAPGVMEKLAAVAQNGHHVHEYRFMHKDGRYRWMRDELNLLRDGAGNPYEILGSWIDVTERKRGEDALRLSEARYRSLIDSAPMGMISFDSSGDITEFNPAVLSILGLPIFERSSRMDLFTLLPMVEAGISEAIFRCMESGESGIGEFQYKSKGRPVFVRVHVVPIRDEEGSITGAHAFLLDLSDQKRAEELIVRSERLKVLGQISGGVGYTLKNFLQIVAGNANMGLTNLDLKDNKGVKFNLEQIVESARSAAEAIRWLHSFAGERAVGTEPSKEIFDLTDSILEAIEMCKLWSKTDLERRKINVGYRLDLLRGCYVEGVPDQVVWVVLNLLKNAVEAMPKGGRIRVNSTVNQKQVVLTIQDNGAGIPDEDIKNISVAFWTSKEGHAGMGLPFSAEIIRQHRGTMGVKRLKPRGTCFIVRLRHVKDPAKKRRSRAAKQAAMKTFRILVVDNEERVLKVLENGLKLAGQKPLAASSGQQALRVLDEAQVDAVVCDYSVDGMVGWELGRAVRDLCFNKGIPKPPFIILTGFADQLELDITAEHPEVDRVLEKPVKVPELVDIIADEITKGGANTSFSGRVDGIDLLDYVQLLLLNRHRAVVEIVSRDGMNGFVFVDKGSIVHAICGDLEAEEALYRCLTFKGGSFSSQPWREPGKITIRKPGQLLLMEAARKRDEMRSDSPVDED